MIKNPLLRKALDNVMKTVQEAELVGRLVTAGTKIIYSQQIFQKLSAELAKSQNPASDVGRGMTLVLGLMAERARGTVKPEAFVQAGMLLVIDALDFLEQAGMLQVNEQVLDEATQEYIEAVLPAMGVKEDELAGQLQQVQSLMADPQKMAAYQQSLGGAKK